MLKSTMYCSLLSLVILTLFNIIFITPHETLQLIKQTILWANLSVEEVKTTAESTARGVAAFTITLLIATLINLFQYISCFNYLVLESTKNTNFKKLSNEDKVIYTLIKISKTSIILLATCSALYYAPQSPFYKGNILIIGMNLYLFTTLTITCVNHKFISKLISNTKTGDTKEHKIFAKFTPFKFASEYSTTFENNKLLIFKYDKTKNEPYMKFEQGKLILTNNPLKT